MFPIYLPERIEAMLGGRVSSCTNLAARVLEIFEDYQRCSDELIAIVSRRWDRGTRCPVCDARMKRIGAFEQHEDGCAWIAAAIALGIADADA